MGASLLSLVRSACGELGLPQPGTVAGATDQQTVQMFALINAVGADLLTRAQWTALQRQAIINVAPAITTTGDTAAGSVGLENIQNMLSAIDNEADWVVSGTAVVISSRLVSRTVAFPGSAVMDTPATATVIGGPLSFARDTYQVPADFVSFINDTQWDRGNQWKLQGPASPQEDQWLRNGVVPTGPRRWFRQVGRGRDVFRLWPPPASGDQPGPLTYEYLSKFWAETTPTSSPGDPVLLPQFTHDTDTCVFNDRLMIEGLKWRFFAAKGFDYSTQYALWERQTQVAIARDGGAPVLSMARRRASIFISPANVQDGAFPGPGNP